MRWTIHILFRPLPWRGLLPVATCMLLHTAPLLRLIPARVFAPAGVVRCVLRIYACVSIQWGTKRVTFYIFTNELAVAACAKDRRSLSTRPRAPPEKETVSNATRGPARVSHTNRGAHAERPSPPPPARASTPIGCSTM